MMTISDIDASQVRKELEYLMDKFPNRTGSIPIEPSSDIEDVTCVYYADEEGSPVSYSYEEDFIVLKTPVCIVGQWIETFHPEFKDDELIYSMLIKNTTMKFAAIPFDPEVKELLVRAQDQQDQETTWGNIDLDLESSY